MEKNPETRVGAVTILGRPNVGKSTLLNCLVGEKLAGISAKPQTTRDVVRGILTVEDGKEVSSPYRGQIIFLDTPGIHRPQDLLGEEMLRDVRDSLEQADLIYWMVYPLPMKGPEREILKWVEKLSVPVFLLINQVDRFPKSDILLAIDSFQKAYSFREYLPISAKTGEQIPLLIQKTLEYLPKGEFLFPEDQLSDQSQRFHVQEMIREKIFLHTGEEIPYATTVRIEQFQEEAVPLHIAATIIVERESQKGIVVGKGGEKIKQIGQAARLDIEKFLGQKVFLELWVKVVPNWKTNRAFLREMKQS